MTTTRNAAKELIKGFAIAEDGELLDLIGHQDALAASYVAGTSKHIALDAIELIQRKIQNMEEHPKSYAAWGLGENEIIRLSALEGAFIDLAA